MEVHAWTAELAALFGHPQITTDRLFGGFLRVPIWTPLDLLQGVRVFVRISRRNSRGVRRGTSPILIPSPHRSRTIFFLQGWRRNDSPVGLLKRPRVSRFCGRWTRLPSSHLPHNTRRIRPHDQASTFKSCRQYGCIRHNLPLPPDLSRTLLDHFQFSTDLLSNI